ncbi:MAG TPA: helix-turn-helix domain-containing protein [Thermoleophilia bacterium]|nr:helix-turn-helix domain-containing protein [Thermoleophilia bacterium]
MIGSELRAERERRGLALAEVEARTKIRVRYLAALEEGRYELLPGHAYARAFLRDYAEELGLDPSPALSELEPPAEQLPPPPPPPPPRLPRVARRTALAGATAVVMVAAVTVAGALLGGGGRHAVAVTHPGSTATTHTRPPTRAHRHARSRTHRSASAPPVRDLIEVAATTGNCWLEIRSGSATGPLLYEATLAAGDTVRFHRRFLWVRVGAPSSLRLTVDGRVEPVPLTAPGDIAIVGRHVAVTA